MQFVVDTYRCEWRDVVEDPEKRRLFKQFVNTDETEPCIEFVSERGQQRPVDWPKDVVPTAELTLPNGTRIAEIPETSPDARTWFKVGRVTDFPEDGAATVKYGKVQIAVYNFTSRGEWFATQNMCPHKQAFVLSRGIVGDQQGEPKVACPLHKKNFSLKSGACLSGEDYQLETFPVRIENESVYLLVPPVAELDDRLATTHFCHTDSANGCHHNPVTTLA
ncbi:MAG: nitrite reductase (NAD(P)H) small subunit [Burkholderiales bacterium 12-64-5]|nr:MAG: nitrite reductase (NAD(P)H) small subunit [Burkholderiales bacterium 12-64-5]